MKTPNTEFDAKKMPWGLMSASAACGLIVGILSMILFQSLTPNQSPLAQQSNIATDLGPTPNWVMQDAKSCDGDISRLNPTEQNRLVAQFHNADTARSMVMASFDATSR